MEVCIKLSRKDLLDLSLTRLALKQISRQYEHDTDLGLLVQGADRYLLRLQQKAAEAPNATADNSGSDHA